MSQWERTRKRLLTAEILLAMIGVGLPLLIVFVLGWLWLREHGLILPVLGTIASFVAAISIIHRIVGRKDGRSARQDSDHPERLTVAPNPEWDDRQRTAYSTICLHISEVLSEPVDDLGSVQHIALSVIQMAAAQFGDKRRDSFDVTLPEVLLFAEQVPSRYRRILKKNVPMVDAISLYRPAQVWRNRATFQGVFQAGSLVWRAQRFVTNPIHGIFGEIWRSSQDYLGVSVSQELLLELQRALFEVVAQVAIDLYSGHLRVSDLDLLEIQLQEIAGDKRRLARPDSPLRIAFIGQVSSGKSSLINALAGQDVAEVDMLPTTDSPAIYELSLDGAAFRILDTPGLDGGEQVTRQVLQQAHEADVIVWVLKANRPSRELDRSAIARFREYYDADPNRLAPPMLLVATFVDKLAPEWPYPENIVPTEESGMFEEICSTAAAELGTRSPIPVATGQDLWNIEQVRRALTGLYADGLKAQRNRGRREARAAGMATNLKRTGSGAWEVVKAGARITKRNLAARNDPEA